MEEVKQGLEVVEADPPILIKYIRDRIYNKNKNFVMLFVGATGSGKSYSALRLAEMLDPSFDINRCCFKARDFMDIINKLTGGEEKVSGKVILWDEFGVEHNAKEFMTISNRVINYFFQTSRHLNLIVIMTVPLLGFIDSATRKLMHGVAEMQGINMGKKTATVKVKMVQTNVMTGKEYPKYLRYRKSNKSYVSRKLKLNLPSEELLEAYEKKKKAFTYQLNKEIMERLLKVQDKKDGVKPQATVEVRKELTPKQEKIMELIREGITNQTEIGKILGVDRSAIAHSLKYIRKKGYNTNIQGCEAV